MLDVDSMILASDAGASDYLRLRGASDIPCALLKIASRPAATILPRGSMSNLPPPPTLSSWPSFEEVVLHLRLAERPAARPLLDRLRNAPYGIAGAIALGACETSAARRMAGWDQVLPYLVLGCAEPAWVADDAPPWLRPAGAWALHERLVYRNPEALAPLLERLERAPRAARLHLLRCLLVHSGEGEDLLTPSIEETILAEYTSGWEHPPDRSATALTLESWDESSPGSFRSTFEPAHQAACGAALSLVLSGLIHPGLALRYRLFPEDRIAAERVRIATSATCGATPLDPKQGGCTVALAAAQADTDRRYQQVHNVILRLPYDDERRVELNRFEGGGGRDETGRRIGDSRLMRDLFRWLEARADRPIRVEHRVWDFFEVVEQAALRDLGTYKDWDEFIALVGSTSLGQRREDDLWRSANAHAIASSDGLGLSYEVAQLENRKDLDRLEPLIERAVSLFGPVVLVVNLDETRRSPICRGLRWHLAAITHAVRTASGRRFKLVECNGGGGWVPGGALRSPLPLPGHGLARIQRVLLPEAWRWEGLLEGLPEGVWPSGGLERSWGFHRRYPSL